MERDRPPMPPNSVCDVNGEDIDPRRDVFGEETPTMTPIEDFKPRVIPLNELPRHRGNIIQTHTLLTPDNINLLKVREYLDRKARESTHGK